MGKGKGKGGVDGERSYSFDEEAPPDDENQPKFIYSRSISAAVYLAHRLGIVALLLVVLWCIFTDKLKEKYLGGLSWNYPNVFNWHPIMMVAGMVICITESLLAFRAFPFDKVINRRVRYLWHTCGIGCMIAGLLAVFKSRNDRNKANLWSLHSWMGISTITFYLIQYILGFYLFFYDSADPDMREAYIPVFAYLDIFIYIAACFTAEAGIVEKNTEMGCTYNTTKIHNYQSQDPGAYYEDLPSGCRISGGLGIIILLMCLCTVYASLELKLPDLANTAGGWEAYKLTEEEARHRVGWIEYWLSLLPFQAYKKAPKARAPDRGFGRGRKAVWIQKTDGDGVYYYNTKTKASQKNRPADF